MQRLSRPLAPPSPEHQATFRKWQRATLIGYGVFSVLLATLSVVVGPARPPTGAGQQVAHATLPSAGPRH